MTGSSPTDATLLPGLAGRGAAERVPAAAPADRDRHPSCDRDQCDGVRCDMAMLTMNDVFARTWGDRAGPAPVKDYWDSIIPAVRAHHRGRVPRRGLLGPGMGAATTGFDFCYDKRLYDRLRHGPAAAVRGHLTGDLTYQEHLCGSWRTTTSPRSRRVRCPAGTGRGRHGAHPDRGPADSSRTAHRPAHPAAGVPGSVPGRADRRRGGRFLPHAIGRPGRSTFHEGRWQLAECSGWPGSGADNLAAWCWDGGARWLVVVNLGDRPATGWCGSRSPTCTTGGGG